VTKTSALARVALGEYIVVYCVEGADVLILRVVHGKRDLDALFDR
jgi:plasmid stabilization system protein ParE